MRTQPTARPAHITRRGPLASALASTCQPSAAVAASKAAPSAAPCAQPAPAPSAHDAPPGKAANVPFRNAWFIVPPLTPSLATFGPTPQER